jgi:putative transposase
MPRQPRLEIARVPMHVTQRGVNRGAVFVDDDDRRHYLELLEGACRKHEVAVHAYVLMDNHVHLLLSAPCTGRVSRAMHGAGQCHAHAFNRRHGRSGTLWQERFKSCLVDSRGHLLQVMRYIELNPVRAAMAAAPEAWRWSSVQGHLGRRVDPLLTPHAAYLGLGRTDDERIATYHAWLRRPIDDDERERIRAYLAQQKALGDPRFQAMVATALDRRSTPRRPGRPRTRTPEAA